MLARPDPQFREAFIQWEQQAAQLWQTLLHEPAFLKTAWQMMEAGLETHNQINQMAEAAGGGLPVDRTPAALVWQEDRVKLWRYHPMTPSQYAIPLLCVPSLINRNYVLDLLRGRSLVAYLVNQGFNVYMLDWGDPAPEDKQISLDDHLDGYLHRAVAAAIQHSHATQTMLMGYCLGGTYAAIYASLYPDLVAGLINLAGPINFHDNGIFSHLTHPDWFDADKLVDTLGNIPAPLLCTTFQMLNPTSHLLRLFQLLEQLDDPDYLRSYIAIQTWIFDQVDFPGEAFRKTIKDLYQGNKLLYNQLTICGRLVRLDNITCPVFTIASRQDETAPAESVTVLNERVSSQDKQLLMLEGPHVGMVAGRKAPLTLWPQLAAWLTNHNHPVIINIDRLPNLDKPEKIYPQMSEMNTDF